MQLSYAIEGYWLARRRDMSDNTERDYALTLRRFTEFVGGERSIADVKSADVDEFLNHLQDDLHLSQKTILNHWIALSSLWSWAEEELQIPHIIRGRVSHPKLRRRQSSPYTADELTRMLAACDRTVSYGRVNKHICENNRPSALRDRAILLVLLDTGIRASELTALRLRDYDAKRGRLVILHGKGDKLRVVFLGTAGKKALWRYLATRPDASADEPLFPARSGRPMDRNGLLHLIVRLANRAGVQGAGVHRFRHTFAVNFLRNGGNVLGLQALLGHECMDTVRIYAKLAEADIETQAKNASPVDRWRL